MPGRVPWEVHVLGEAAPEVRRLFGGGIAVADAVGVVAPVGVLAVAVLPGVAPLALATHYIVFDEDQVAFLEALAAHEFPTRLGNDADVLVPHDHRGLRRRAGVELHVGAADARDLHLHQRRVFRNLRHWELADLGLARRRAHGRQDFFAHTSVS